jgi:murein DD-endopeptidase MepM/ murein hydrolase activator NlpD
MDTPSKPAPAIALAALALVGGLTALPILATAGGAGSPPGCGPVGEIADDGTPSILGSATLTVADLRAWWNASARGQPSRLRIDIGDLIAVYLAEAEAEDVRGDVAFAQAVAETGHFANSDTSINNFAGIAHYDGTASGDAFPGPVVGVRAHIQLLKKYAAGNGTALAHADVSPDAGATATTWGSLAGTWASSSTYWSLIESVYGSMLAHAEQAMPAIAVIGGAPAGCPASELAVSGDYVLPVERRWYDEHPDWFTRPHHDYPAIDIPVPAGTPLFAVTSGVVVSTPTSGRCGIGVVINGDDGAQYTYCHGLPGSHAITTGDRVAPGQYLMHSASTGNSTGPHLHLAIRIGRLARCPQPFLTGIAEGRSADAHGLPLGGCTY